MAPWRRVASVVMSVPRPPVTPVAPEIPGRRARLLDTVLAKVLRQPGARTGHLVERGVRVPMRDGVTLNADHYAPTGATRNGTILVRTPYGRGFPGGVLQGAMLAARGYHVLLQSVRGTFGSGGTFRPMAQETDDARDTVAWLRDQPWFDGRLGTLGASYVGWTQWTLLQDPPPELRASVVQVGPHDFRRAVFGSGAFTLNDFLGWTATVAGQEAQGPGRIVEALTAGKRVAAVVGDLPLPAAAEPLLRGRAPWYREWLEHADDDSDPFWEPYRAGEALERVETPVLLTGGWSDIFLDQTVEQYAALRGRGVDVALTIGDWTHMDTQFKGARTLSGETLAWFDEHLAGAAARSRQPVRVQHAGTWRELPEWPPPGVDTAFHLHAGARLEAKPSHSGATTFRYDPTDPTPAVGGRVMTGSTGRRENSELEARPDVVTFTSAPLPVAVDVAGTPRVELALSVDNPHADVFVRLCEVTVDRRGRNRSHNVADGFLRLDASVPAGEPHRLTVGLDPCAHRFEAGSRIRLQVSGGAFPRFARNPGTGEPTASATELVPSRRTVQHRGSRVVLPVVQL